MYKVPIVNLQTIGAYCGTGVGDTLEEAQKEAMRIATTYYAGCNPRLAEERWAVYVDGGINC